MKIFEPLSPFNVSVEKQMNHIIEKISENRIKSIHHLEIYKTS